MVFGVLNLETIWHW